MPSPEQRPSEADPELEEVKGENPEVIEQPWAPYIIIKEKSVSFLGVEVPKASGGDWVPEKAEFKEEYFFIEGHHEVMREIATALLLNKPLLLEGGTGVYNKTTTVAFMCRLLNMNYCKVNFDHSTDVENVIGGRTIKIDENGKEVISPFNGNFMNAVEYGGVAFIDEYNRKSRLSDVVNPIVDAILNGKKVITNSQNENKPVTVHKDFRLISAQNPPGFEGGHEYSGRDQHSAETFGRWIYRKLPIEYTEEQENKLFAGMIGENVQLNISESEFRHPGEGIPVKELAEVPGMVHWRREIITILRTLEAKSAGSKREMAKNQRQNLYFNPRLKKTIIDYIARFYNGDINETVKNAFETCIVGMYSSDADKQSVRTLVDQASWTAPKVESKRRGLEIRDVGAEKKAALIKEIEGLKSEIEDSGKLPEGLGTPEAGREENPTIKAKNEKGEPVEFNFEQIKNYWVDFYKKNNLPELAEAVEEMEITFTKEQQDRIKELAEKEGFDKMIIFAGNDLMQANSIKIKQETEKEMDGLVPKQQYKEKDDSGKPVGTWLSETVQPAFPDKIKNNNRPDKPYILFCKDAPEVDEVTRKALKESEGKGEKKNSAENLREYIKKKDLTGFTLEEYLIFQREHTTQNKEAAKPHPENDHSTWILDSELDADSSEPGQVLRANWHPDYRRVGVYSYTPGYSSSYIGARSSAIFEIL